MASSSPRSKVAVKLNPFTIFPECMDLDRSSHILACSVSDSQWVARETSYSSGSFELCAGRVSVAMSAKYGARTAFKSRSHTRCIVHGRSSR